MARPRDQMWGPELNGQTAAAGAYEPFDREVAGLLTIDMERFSRPEWNDWVQVRLRERLYRALLATLRRLPAGELAACEIYDRGDGAIVLIRATIPLVDVVSLAVHDFPRELREANAGQPERIRVRGAIHSGWVTHDRYGVSGTALNHLVHLEQSDTLRQRLARAGATWCCCCRTAFTPR